MEMYTDLYFVITDGVYMKIPCSFNIRVIKVTI